MGNLIGTSAGFLPALRRGRDKLRSGFVTRTSLLPAPIAFSTLRACSCGALLAFAWLALATWPAAAIVGGAPFADQAIARHVVIGPEASILEDSARPAIPPAPRAAAKNGIVPLKSLCKEAIRASEKHIILEALRANRWNRRKAAQELKISYRLLIYKIRDAGLMTKRKGSIVNRQENESGLSPSVAS